MSALLDLHNELLLALKDKDSTIITRIANRLRNRTTALLREKDALIASQNQEIHEDTNCCIKRRDFTVRITTGHCTLISKHFPRIHLQRPATSHVQTAIRTAYQVYMANLPRSLSDHAIQHRAQIALISDEHALELVLNDRLLTNATDCWFADYKLDAEYVKKNLRRTYSRIEGSTHKYIGFWNACASGYCAWRSSLG
jgi:hypothetical protein